MGQPSLVSEEKERKVQDISLAAYLISPDAVTGHPEFKVKRLEKVKFNTLFIFDNSTGLQAKIEAYFAREGRVDPLQFSENLRSLKSRARQG